MTDYPYPIQSSRFLSAPVPAGFGVQFYADAPGSLFAELEVDASKEGPPGHVHGGALVTLVDEAMGGAAWNAGYRVLAVNLNINLRLAVPLAVRVRVTGRVERKEGRKIITAGTLTLPDGRVAVEGTGIFVEAPHLLGDKGMNPFLRFDPDR